MSAETLAGPVLAAVGALDGATVREATAATEVVAGGTVVAALAGGVLEVRLRPEVAAAALRTPDVTPSPRGSGWVRFAPAVVDGFALDRATAWATSAVRLVLEGDERP